MQLTAASVQRGEHPGEFAIVSSDCNAGLTLVSGGSCSMDIVFRPTGDAGARRAAVAVAHDWVGGETALAIVGEAAAPPPASPPPVADSGGGGAAGGIGAAALLLVIVGLRSRRSGAATSRGLWRRVR